MTFASRPPTARFPVVGHTAQERSIRRMRLRVLAAGSGASGAFLTSRACLHFAPRLETSRCRLLSAQPAFLGTAPDIGIGKMKRMAVLNHVTRFTAQ